MPAVTFYQHLLECQRPVSRFTGLYQQIIGKPGERGFYFSFWTRYGLRKFPCSSAGSLEDQVIYQPVQIGIVHLY